MPVVGVVYSLVEHGSINWGLILIITAGTVVASWPLAFLADVLLPVVPNQYGLACYNTFSFKREVAWDRIVGTKRMSVFPGLPYLSILDGTGYFNRGLIPLFSVGKGDFYDSVVEIVGEQHPLAIALRRECFANEPRNSPVEVSD